MNLHDNPGNLIVNWNETSLPLDPLTPREQETAKLMMRGVTTNVDIAAHLHITPDSAGQHVDNLRSKFGAKSRAQLVSLLFQTFLANLLSENPDTVHQGV